MAERKAPMPTTQGDFYAYAVGPPFASVCSSLPIDETTARLNREHPTGIASQWAKANEPFKDGTPNGVPCHDCPETHRHWLFTC